MRFILLFALAITTSACATRSIYKPFSQSGGYSEEKVDDRIAVARFAGNANTHPDDALLFSKFRAQEICGEQGFKVTRILDIKNLTTSQSVLQTSSYNYTAPTYYSGYVSSNNTFNVNSSGGSQVGGSSSWVETYHYPTFDTYFTCTNNIYLTMLKLKMLSPDDTKTVVKDFLGAMLVEEVADNSPNRGTLHAGDIVLKIDGERISNLVQFSKAIDQSKNKDKILMTIIREGKNININARAVDVAAEYNKEAAETVQQACTVREIRKRPLCGDRQPAFVPWLSR